VGYYSLAFFHLVTHAIFKAILFLCAGTIIHGVGGSQDIRRMGLVFGLSPLVSGLLILARLSLSGFPFLSGFYSKDLILEVVYIVNRRYLFIFFVLIATIFTVTYSLRLAYYSLWKGVFEGPSQGYYESEKIVFPIGVIGIFVVFLGCFLSWLIFPHPVFIHLAFFVKILNLVLVLLGVWFFFILYNNVWERGEMGGISYFLGSIWFLPGLRGVFFIPRVTSSLYYQLNVDQGWFEEFGSLGFRKGGLPFLTSLLVSNFGGLKYFIILRFIIFLFILFYFYSLN